METSLCTAVNAGRNCGRKSKASRKEEKKWEGYAEGEKEEQEGGGGGKVVIEKGNGGEGKSKISHSCSIFPAVWTRL